MKQAIKSLEEFVLGAMALTGAITWIVWIDSFINLVTKQERD